MKKQVMKGSTNPEYGTKKTLGGKMKRISLIIGLIVLLSAVPLFGQELTVSLSPDTPPAQTILSNTDDVLFVKFDFSATNENIEINEIEIHRFGLPHDSSIENLRLVDESTGTIIGVVESLINGYALFDDTFGFEIDEGTTLTVSLLVDINEQAQNGDTIGFEIESPGSINAIATTTGCQIIPEGDFPVQGNLMSIANMLNILHVPDQYPTIQAGIDAAEDGDWVLVEPGTYYENINFNGKNITVGSLFLTTNDTIYISQTVIDGNQNDRVVTFPNCESEAKLIGFTIQNGNTGAGGGGIVCQNNSSPTLSNLKVINNIAYNGGGICVLQNSHPSILNSTISNNAIFGNGVGGGIAFYQNSDVLLINVEIKNNYAYSGGGLFSSNSNIHMKKVIISENIAPYGDAIYSECSDIEIVNTTITNQVGPVAVIYGHNSNLIMVNSILWNLNAIQQVYYTSPDSNTFMVIDHSNILNGDEITVSQNCTLYWIDGNIDSDPQFVDSVNNDYHLTENSPCIDAGTDYFEWQGEIIVNLTPNEYWGSAPDMGCYESPYTDEPEIELYLDSPDTLYVLPCEWWYSQYGIEMSNGTPIIMTECFLWFNDLLVFDDFEYLFNLDLTNIGTTYNETGNGWHRYTWLCNSGTGVEWWWLFNLYGVNNLYPGNQINYHFHLIAGTVDFNYYYKIVEKSIVTIDGIRGDVNDDGFVTQEDVDLMVLSYNQSLPPPWYGKYTESGLNFGRGIVLFSRPDLLSDALLNIYVNNPGDPILQGLGIGELMSTTAYGNAIIHITPYSYEITGNQLTIITDGGNIINVTAVLGNGELWQYTSAIENGEITINIPDPGLEYKIETKYWANAQNVSVEDITTVPEKPILSQNFPNPFNLETQISYNIPKSSEVILEIYNIKGQRVKTLVNNETKIPGSYNVIWDGKDDSGKPVANGIYFYRLDTNKVSFTKKMILMR